MTDKNLISLIGYASGIAAGNPGCGNGPQNLVQENIVSALTEHGVLAKWEAILHPLSEIPILTAVAELNHRLASNTKKIVEAQHKFAVLGGDHSSAIGTWSGVATALRAKGPIGLIWIDAHMDSHTFETTESGNIHGMPVASLLGYGAKELIHIMDNTAKLLPENICLIGVRSYEKGEAELLKRLGVKIYMMPEVKQRGIANVLQEAVEKVKANTCGFGLSIDLDAIDPQDAPGVGLREYDGIMAEALCKALQAIHLDPKFLGVEIAEYNPQRDENEKTLKLILQMVQILFNKGAQFNDNQYAY